MRKPEDINTVSELLDATADFYVKKRRGWTAGKLFRKANNSYCILGAMSAVVTNEELLKTYGGAYPNFKFKKIDLIREAAHQLSKHFSFVPNIGSIFNTITTWNDNWNTDRRIVIKTLRQAAKAAREKENV